MDSGACLCLPVLCMYKVYNTFADFASQKSPDGSYNMTKENKNCFRPTFNFTKSAFYVCYARTARHSSDLEVALLQVFVIVSVMNCHSVFLSVVRHLLPNSSITICFQGLITFLERAFRNDSDFWNQRERRRL